MLLAAVTGMVAALSAQSPPPGFTWQSLATGLQSGTAMAFLPDGRLLITERATGNIRVFENGALQAQPWATIAVASGGSWAEQGLLGIAVDPGFLANGYVYVFYTDASGTENRVARLREQGRFGTGLTVLTPANALPAVLYHNGGPLLFGHDGTLFVATGDALSGSNAQDMQSWLGKVLRFDVPNLTVPATNPFPGSAIFTLGHRNQFGLALHPVSSSVYQTENGSALMDEVNLLAPGGNFGWPVYEGAEPLPNPAYVDPLVVYQPTTAPTGTCFYTGEHYPLQYRHGWFFCDYNMNRLRLLTLNGAGTAVLSQVVFDQLPGSGYGVQTGPDGNLWLLTNANGGYGANELGRYVHANESAPSAQLSSVSNKTLGGSITVCVHGGPGALAAPWLSLAQYPAPLPTPFGNLWVPMDAMLDALLCLYDERAYVGLAMPNAPAFLGASVHLQALVLTGAGLLLSNPSELVIRG
ncbi:MAG: PQQ-dependent sugar dehydrogenase [Planctomycetota bacterium]